MKLLLLALLLTAATSQAATNFFARLPVGDRAYTNARIENVTAAYAVVHHENGGAQVLLSDLPPAVRKQFNYDPEKAKKEVAAQANRQKLRAEAWQERLEDYQRQEAWRGEPADALVISVGRQLHTWTESVISISNRMYKVLLANVPGHMKDYFARKAFVDTEVARLQSFTLNESDRLDREEDYWRSRNPYTYHQWGDRVFWDHNYRRENALNRIRRERVALEDSRNRLADLRAEAQSLADTYESYASCIVRQTVKTYAGLQIWECGT